MRGGARLAAAGLSPPRERFQLFGGVGGIGARLGFEAAMYGRTPHTIYATFTNVRPGASAAEFRSWYEDMHRPDSFELGLFDAASRQRAASPSAAEWLTLWEAGYPDTKTALDRIRPAAGRLREQGRVLPVLDVVFQQFLQRVALEGPCAKTRVRSMTTLQNDWSRPARGQLFEEWWAEAVLAAQPPLDAHSAWHAYAAFDLEDERAGKFLVLLESDAPTREVQPLWQDVGQHSLSAFGPATPVYPEPGAPVRAPAQGDPSPEARRALHVVHWQHDSDAVSAASP